MLHCAAPPSLDRFRFPMMRIRPTAVALLASIVVLSASPASAASPTLDRIKASGTITFAFRDNAAPFSFRDREGNVRGYSVDLCTRIAAAIQKQLGLASLAIKWRAVDAANRLSVVASGEAAAECGTTTITLSRLATVDFSVPTFVDGGGVLVRDQSTIARLTDLKGRRVAVIAGTTTEQALARALAALESPATLVPVKDAVAGMAQLEQGNVDGYASDRVVLAGLRAREPNAADFVLIDQDFSYEPYAIVVRRDDPDFRLAVNRALVALYRSGEIDGIFQRWLGPLGRPGPLLHAMFYLNTLPE
jgi:ABC-type amino acid transport substrate-binding protein